MPETIKSPKIEWVWKPKYKLVDIQKEIKVADFERKVSPEHVNKIALAIEQNKFWDNVIHVVRQGDIFVLIDSQHRITALTKLFREGKLKEYDLMFAIYPNDMQRIVFQRINMGKKLSNYDVVHAIDDKKHFFFNDLRDYLLHYRGDTKVTFTDMIFTHYYYISKVERARQGELEAAINSIKPEDTKPMVWFISSIYDNSPGAYHNELYKTYFFRNIYRVGRERRFNREKFDHLILFLMDEVKQGKFKDLSKLNSYEKSSTIYNYLIKIVDSAKWA